MSLRVVKLSSSFSSYCDGLNKKKTTRNNSLLVYSFIRECVDREYREKEKIRSDLEKAEKLKNQLATEVDEHHSAIEQTNNLKLR